MADSERTSKTNSKVNSARGGDQVVTIDPRMLSAVTTRLCELKLVKFVEYGWHVIEPEVPFINNWHIEAVCSHLEAVAAGKIDKLLINMPPGCSKSRILCVYWPAWVWITNPAARWIFASYDMALSTRDSVYCRDLVESEWYQSQWGDRFEIKGDQNQKTKFETDKTGWRIATSVGGRGTGEHPDFKIIDDSLKADDAENELALKHSVKWWKTTMATRGVSRGAREVVSGQRLNMADLPGALIDEGKHEWLCFPMRFELEEAKKRKPTSLGFVDPRKEEGELLWPELFPEDVVSSLEATLGGPDSFDVAGQLQQRPVPASGGLFKSEWFADCFVTDSPRAGRRLRYWDKAGTEGAGAATAGVRMSMHNGIYYIEHVKRAQLDYGARDDMIKATAEVDASEFDNTVEVWLEQEPGSGGKQSAQISVKQLAKFPVYLERPKGNKVVRARPFSAQCKAGNVKIVRNPDGTDNEWIQPFISELCSFPMGKFKDQADSASGAFGQLAAGSDIDIQGDLVCSGGEDDPAYSGDGRLSDDELAEVPAGLADIIDFYDERERSGEIDRFEIDFDRG